MHNHQRDGLHQTSIPTGKVAYEPNSLGGGCPFHSPAKMKSYVHLTERIDAHKVRARSASFGDFFSQAKLFFNSQSEPEKNHIRDAFSFELSKVETKAIRARMVDTISLVDAKLAQAIADNVGVKISTKVNVPPNPAEPENNIIPENRATDTALEDIRAVLKGKRTKSPAQSDALSMVKTAKPSLETRKIAILAGPGINATSIKKLTSALESEGAAFELVGEDLGPIVGTSFEITKTFDNCTALHYDAVWVSDGAKELSNSGLARRFILQTFKHCKALGGSGSGAKVLDAALSSQAGFIPEAGKASRKGVISDANSNAPEAAFVAAAKVHRYWEREEFTKNMAT